MQASSHSSSKKRCPSRSRARALPAPYYIVEGTQNDAEACTQAYTTAPEEFTGIPKKSVAISERLTDTVWKIEVHYGSEQSSSGGGGDGDEDDEATMNFDCSAGTKHMAQAIRQTCVFAGNGETKDSASVASAIPIGWNGKVGSELQFMLNLLLGNL